MTALVPALVGVLMLALAPPPAVPAGGQETPVQGGVPAPPLPDALVGPYWTLVAVDAYRPHHSPGERLPHLEFYAGGNVAGWDGCNSVRSTYTVSDDRLKFGVLIGTLKTCTVPDKLDRRLREALVVTRRWRIADGELTLLDDAGTMLARFEADVSR
jgi:heat shock protein HslJ